MKNRSYGPARVRSASYSETDNTIDIVWSTGSDVLREDWDGPYIERLLMGDKNVRLDRLNSNAPFLDTHCSDSLSNVIGSVVPGTAKIEDGRGIATVLLSKAPGDAGVVQKIRDGIIKNISVGYLVHASTRADGDPPVVTVTDWEPLEVSAVPIPADPTAQIRSATGRSSLKRRTRAQAAAAEARALLKPSQSREQARGADEARKLLRLVGRA